MKRIKWLIYELKWFIIGGLHVITGRYFLKKDRYGTNILHDDSEGNDAIRNKIESGDAFAFCRYSYTEMDIAIRSYTESMFGIPSTGAYKWLDIFCEPGESDSVGAAKYRDLVSRAFESADIIGIWPNLHMGDALMDMQSMPQDVFVADARCVEPYYYSCPWTAALRGKKVLVVSPFSEAVRKQYERRELLWDNKDMLPEFSLDTEDAVWYYKGERDKRFSDWFKAYEYLYNRIMEHDFDVAILGCGYFGFPLAARIRDAGRQAIHMGGATQLLFGIKGSRWDVKPHISCYYNEYWIRPDEKLKPADDKNLDDGCYW